MDPIAAGALSILAMLALIIVGVPVSISMGIVAATGMWIFGGPAFLLTNLETLPYTLSTQFTFIVIPMFVLMGVLTSNAGITAELYTAAFRWTSRFRGSLYYATTIASAGFAAINGATVVSALLFTRIALPEMVRLGFHRGLSAGCICAAGALAAMIPPSVVMVLYGIITGESVGQLLIAGVVPGILTAAAYVVGMAILLKIRPDYAPVLNQHFSLRERLESLQAVWPVLALALIVLGGIYTGLMFPSSAGAVGAMGALLIGVMRRRLGPSAIWNSVKQAASTTAVLFLILIGGLLFARLLLINGFIMSFTDAIARIGLSAWVFIALVIVLLLVLGCLVDSISMMVMTIPFLYPIAKHLGIDPIWFGVIICKLIEIAVISPPIGINLYAVLMAAEGRVSAGELFRGVIPFLGFELVTLGLLLAVPELCLWLPRTMVR